MEAGWLGQYKAGFSYQWLDITGFSAGKGIRSFTSNPNDLFCEGKFVDTTGIPLDPKDPVVWASTGLIAETGKPVL